MYVISFAGSPKIVDLTYDPKSGVITCNSTGGPVTSVFWNRNGTTNQIISNFHNATYTNKLIINGSLLEDYKGIFNCTVRNTRGSNSSSIGEFYGIIKVCVINSVLVYSWLWCN